jgi:hypothetical protein
MTTSPLQSGASASVLTLAELARELPALQPPPAYRLSLDSGIHYRNVRHALENPLRARVSTWRKLLASLRIHLLAAPRVEDVIWPGEDSAVIGFDDHASALVAPSRVHTVSSWRIERRHSRLGLAARAAVSIDALGAVERGRGNLATLAKVCEALGVQLLHVLPVSHASLEELWRERAVRCLEEPAQYYRRASMASAAAIERSSDLFTASNSSGTGESCGMTGAALPHSMPSTISSKGA